MTKEFYEELEREQNGVEEEHSKEYDELRGMGFLSSKRVKEIEHPQTDEVEYLLENRLSQLTLQVTQDCNFRCSYCIYSDINNDAQRHHERKNMKFEVAKEAINYLFDHSRESDRLSIGFYGGEPLLNFPLIKRVVEYAEPLLLGRDCQYSITSNCSLLTGEMINFFIDHNFSLIISMDGPENIQNINRRFSGSGKGSYRKVLKNVLNIKNRNEEWFNERVGLSMVIDPRNDYDEIISIFKVFNQNKTINAVTISDEYSLQKTFFSENYLWKQKYHQFLALIEEICGEQNQGVSREARQLIDALKREQEQYMLTKELPDKYAPGGPCIPGQTKLFVNVEGDLYPCEKVSEKSKCLQLGTIKNHISGAKVKELINFSKETDDVCKNCWALRHCDHCLQVVDNHGVLSAKAGLQYCNKTREKVEAVIMDFAMLQEIREMGRLS